MAVTTPYDGLAPRWDAAAGMVYRPLARSLVAASPVALAGRLVLDAGSGTGAVAQAAAARGARVVAADRSRGMLSYGSGRGWPAVAADVLALPLRDGRFDAAVAGFLLNHLPPVPALAELARVVRPGGVVLASTWAGGRRDPVKAAADAVLCSWGWVPPAWYQEMQRQLEQVSGNPERLAATARQAGLVSVRAWVHREDLGLLRPHAVVAYRLALPHIAPWEGKLDAPARAELVRQAVGAVGPHVQEWRPSVIMLAGRVRRQSSREASQRQASQRPASRSSALT
ncbi:MAG TPA: class I SAM-dependent methyltransferase [Pseudonocardiaceae bacterium]|nr:class I SAM-dependent methyltransferase [Pseudonocardiaceae bacterium]